MWIVRYTRTAKAIKDGKHISAFLVDFGGELRQNGYSVICSTARRRPKPENHSALMNYVHVIMFFFRFLRGIEIIKALNCNFHIPEERAIMENG